MTSRPQAVLAHPLAPAGPVVSATGPVIARAQVEAIETHRLVEALRSTLRAGTAECRAGQSAGVTAPMTRDAAELFDHMCRGALGAIAFDVLAPRRSRVLALIGMGADAELHLVHALRLRRFSEVRVYSSRPVAASELARRIRRSARAQVEIAATPEEALRSADCVILAGATQHPVIDADWVMPDAHVNLAAPQTVARHEVPPPLLRRARIVATDDPDYVRRSGDSMLCGRTIAKPLDRLGRLDGSFDPDRSRGLTVFAPSGSLNLHRVALGVLAG